MLQQLSSKRYHTHCQTSARTTMQSTADQQVQYDTNVMRVYYRWQAVNVQLYSQQCYCKATVHGDVGSQADDIITHGITLSGGRTCPAVEW